MSAHTPGPWKFEPSTNLIIATTQRTALMGDFRGSQVAELLCNALALKEQDDVGAADHAEVAANGALLAAAPDHALLLCVIGHGLARWEPFEPGSPRGEVCVGGFRYATEMDRFGCPVLNDSIRAALRREL